MSRITIDDLRNLGWRFQRRFGAAIVGLLAAFMGVTLGSDAVAEIRIKRDLLYKVDAKTEYERQRCRLDLYLPSQAKGFPTIVWFHGGGLRNGDKAKEMTTRFCRRFANDGIAVVAANYRLHPQVKYPAYLEDAAAAVAHTVRCIKDEGGDPTRVFVAGHSAGGYLAAMVGLDRRLLAPHSLSGKELAGVIPVSGQMITHSTIRLERGLRRKPLIDDAAPLFHVAAGPPFLVIVGGKDLPARAEENRYFTAAMKAAGHKETAYREFNDRDHSTIIGKAAEQNDEVAKAMSDFILRGR